MRKKILRSRSGFEKPESREEAIMQNILGASNVLEPSESNIEEILKSILYNTPYTKEAEFEIEKILLAIKNNGTYDGEGESRDMKILIAILNDLNYTEEVESRIEELFIEWLYQRSQIKILEGVPPLTFIAKGKPLINYEISGNMQQTGTPTPSSPIQPSECGDLETVGAKAGQYKIPISSANTTMPVYLGEVESTRKIGKLVLTGNEAWSFSTSGNAKRAYLTDWRSALGNSLPLCTHYIGNSGGGSYPSDGKCLINSNGVPIFNANFVSDKTEWIAYLQQQYAAGTPVCVWYVLATPQTAVVNEPLRKIGNYADTVSMEQAGAQIPTNNGTTVIDVDTTVKPSNIYIEYK